MRTWPFLNKVLFCVCVFSSGGIGCRPTNPSLKESLDAWSPAVYALHLPSDNDTALENVTVSFSDVEIFVRSNEVSWGMMNSGFAAYHGNTFLIPSFLILPGSLHYGSAHNQWHAQFLRASRLKCVDRCASVHWIRQYGTWDVNYPICRAVVLRVLLDSKIATITCW